MYRNALILINIIALLFLTYLTIGKYPDSPDGTLVLIGLYAYVISNLIYIFIKGKNNNKDDSLISLYFKRKALEEKKKIEQLQESL